MKKHYNSCEKSNIYVETSNFHDNNNKNQRNFIKIQNYVNEIKRYDTTQIKI